MIGTKLIPPHMLAMRTNDLATRLYTQHKKHHITTQSPHGTFPDRTDLCSVLILSAYRGRTDDPHSVAGLHHVWVGGGRHRVEGGGGGGRVGGMEREWEGGGGRRDMCSEGYCCAVSEECWRSVCMRGGRAVGLSSDVYVSVRV